MLNWGYQLEVPTGKRDKVPEYEVKIQVNYSGIIVANSEKEAEENYYLINCLVLYTKKDNKLI